MSGPTLSAIAARWSAQRLARLEIPELRIGVDSDRSDREALLAALARRWHGQRLGVMPMPEWSAPGGEPMAAHWRGWTLADEHRVQRWISSDAPSGYAAIVWSCALDASGERLFGGADDRLALARMVEGHALKRLAGAIVAWTVPDDGEAAGAPAVVHFRGWTLADEDRIKRAAAADDARAFAAVIADKALTPAGAPIFRAGDAERIAAELESHVAKRIALEIMGATITLEDAQGN